jgi:hypothetical protein
LVAVLRVSWLEDFGLIFWFEFFWFKNIWLDLWFEISGLKFPVLGFSWKGTALAVPPESQN